MPLACAIDVMAVMLQLSSTAPSTTERGVLYVNGMTMQEMKPESWPPWHSVNHASRMDPKSITVRACVLLSKWRHKKLAAMCDKRIRIRFRHGPTNGDSRLVSRTIEVSNVWTGRNIRVRLIYSDILMSSDQHRLAHKSNK